MSGSSAPLNRTPVALANADPGVAFSAIGFSNLVILGTGLYELELSAPFTNIQNVVAIAQVTGGGASRSSNVSLSAPNFIVVAIYDAGGAAINSPFSIAVYDIGL